MMDDVTRYVDEYDAVHVDALDSFDGITENSYIAFVCNEHGHTDEKLFVADTRDTALARAEAWCKTLSYKRKEPWAVRSLVAWAPTVQ